MNKQAFTFLSLFTLILMFSIYYILLPTSNDVVVSNIENNAIERLESSYKEKVNSLNNIQDDIISSSDATILKKESAINDKQKFESITKNENKIKEILLELGVDSCFVEINDYNIRVVIKGNKEDYDVLKIMNGIYEHNFDEYLVEIKFMN